MTLAANRFTRILFSLIASVLVIIIALNLYRRHLNEQLAVAVQTGKLSEVRALLDRHADVNSTAPDPEDKDAKPRQIDMFALSLWRLLKNGYGDDVMDLADAYLRKSNAAAMSKDRSRDQLQTVHWVTRTGVEMEGPTPTIAEGQSLLQTIKAKAVAHEEAEAICSLLIERGATSRMNPKEVLKSLSTVCSAGSLSVLRNLLANQKSLSDLDSKFVLMNNVNYYRSFDSYSFRQYGSSEIQEAHGRNDLSQEIRDIAMQCDQSCQRTALEMARLLQEHGEHLSVEQAVDLCDVQMLETTLKQARPGELEPALNHAVERGNLEMVHRLLSAGADPNHASNQDYLPLNIAVNRKNLPIVKLLLEHGASVNPASIESPLAKSLKRRDLEIGRLLMAQGADVRWVDYDGRPLLSLALESTPSLVPDLLGRGASVNPKVSIHKPSSASTAASTAASTSASTSASILASTAPSTLGATSGFKKQFAFSTVVVSEHPPISPLLSALWYAPQYEQRLLRAGARLDVDRPHMLLYAARKGRADLFARLLAYGGDVNEIDQDGETPLIQAVQHAPGGVRILLEHGAKPDVATRLLQTPLTLAVLANDIETVRLLIQHGAKVDFHATRGHTALYYAHKHNYIGIISLLEKAGAHSEMR